MNWKIKGLVQKGLTYVPGGQGLNDQLQRRFGVLRHFEENIADKVNDWKLSMRYLRDCEFELLGALLFEVGTGWYPTLPICFSLAGARRVISCDIVNHIDAGLTFRMVRALSGHLDEIADASGISLSEIQKRYGRLLDCGDMSALLSCSGVELRAPADARATELASNSVDLVYSNSVMEHVPKETIREIMRESRRILRPGGMALHNVACNDHYAHMDSGISFVNFLRYSDTQWKLWNNSLQYQNRMRAPEFLGLAASAGMEVIYRKTFVRPGTREALVKLEVAAQFSEFSVEDLATTTVDFVARKPAA